MKCPSCGFINGSNVVKCANCGQSLVFDTSVSSVGSVASINAVENSVNSINTNVVNNVSANKVHVKKKKGKKLLALIIIILFIYLTPKCINFINKKFNSGDLVITNLKSSSKTGDKLFVVDTKLDNLKGKVRSLKGFKDGKIKIYVGNLILTEQNINKSFNITNFNLAEGLNNVEITYNLGKKNYKECILLYNNSLDNLGDLDNKDDDSDGLPNYLEEAYNTNKRLVDTDGDGLSDYQEVYLTGTNPTKIFTIEGLNDANNDMDGDGLSNIDEVRYGSNPMVYDTDSDGLSDGLEKQYGSNYKISDTDSDGFTDYDEVVKFNTSPVVKDDFVSGDISNNKNVSLLVNNISSNDIEKVNIVEAGYASLNERLDGYILPPYKIDSDVDINSTISFTISTLNLPSGSVPTIYEINSETMQYSEVPTYNNGTTISAAVTNTDNLYMLFDKNYLEKEFNNVSISDDVYNMTFSNGDHYMSASFPLFHIIRHFFNMKDVPNESLKIFCFGECEKSYLQGLEKILEDDYEGTIDFEIKKVNKLGYFFARRFYDLALNMLNKVCEKESDTCSSVTPINPDSVINTYFDVVTIFDVIGSDDVGTALLNDKSKISNFILTKQVDLSDTKDSNNDGISDALTELIISGNITTREGYNPFEGLTLDQINKNDDYDKDGLKNNEEISIEKLDGVYQIIMKSNPTKKDSDDDGILDPKDPKPLVSFDSRYVFRDLFKGEPSNVYGLIDEVNQSNKLYGVGNIIPYNNDWYVKYVDLDGVEKYSPYTYDFQFNIMYLGAEGGHLYAKDAAKAHDMFFDGNGKMFTEADATKDLRDDPSIVYYMDKTIDDYISLAKNTVVDGEKLVFENSNLMPGIDPAHTSDGSSQSTNVFGFLHYSSSNSIGEVSNNDGVYRIRLRYFIEDIYDWKNNSYEYGFAGQVEVMYYNQVLIGKAKNFLVHIEYDIEIYYDSNTGEKRVEKFMTPIYK